MTLTDIESRRSRRLADHAVLDFNAAFAPDGGSVAFVSERDGNAELYNVQTDGTGLRRLTDEFALDDHPAWSPDGRRLAFSSTREAADKPGRAWNAVYVMEADGTRPRRLTPIGSADYSPAWSPAGNMIAVASGSGRSGDTDLYVMAPDGTSRRRVVADAGWPAFAGDGRSLFFHSKRDGKWGIWRVGLDGTALERVTPPDVDAYTPSASVDGKRLVAAVSRGGHRQIVVVDLASHSSTDLTDEPTDHWNPSISPDGRTVVLPQGRPRRARPQCRGLGRAARYGAAAAPAGGGLPGLLPRRPARGPDRGELRPPRRDGHRWHGPQGTSLRGLAGALQHLLGPPRRSDRLFRGSGVRGPGRQGGHRHCPPRRLRLLRDHP